MNNHGSLKKQMLVKENHVVLCEAFVCLFELFSRRGQIYVWCFVKYRHVF